MRDMLGPVECSAHPDVTVMDRCSLCDEPCCERCLTYDVNGHAACAACGRAEGDRSRTLGSALFALVALGYLVALGIGYLLFRARPFVGGLAAVVALALGRALQLSLRIPIVTRGAPRAG